LVVQEIFGINTCWLFLRSFLFSKSVISPSLSNDSKILQQTDVRDTGLWAFLENLSDIGNSPFLWDDSQL
jgi:hypothetical protein